MRAMGKAMGALLDFEPTADTGTVVHREQPGAEVTSSVAMTRHPLPSRWRIDSGSVRMVDDGANEWILHSGRTSSSRPSGTSLLVPLPLYPFLPVQAPILGRSTDDWTPVHAREVRGSTLIAVTIEKVDSPGVTGSLTVDTASKILRRLDLNWVTIDIVEWSPLMPGQEIFSV